MAVNRRTLQTGFTIIELLIVIVVIGILAAIVLVAYSGITRQAATAVLQSDLKSAATQLETAKVTAAGQYPSSSSELKASTGTTYQYTYNAGDNSYCLSGTSDRDGVSAYHVSSANLNIQEGLCSGHTMPSDNTFENIAWTQGIDTPTGIWYTVDMSDDGDNVVAAASTGYIYTSADSGANWTQRTSAGSRGWSDVASSADGTKLAAVTNGGYIYTSSDSGANWTERTAAGNAYWYGVGMSADGTKIFAANYDAEIPIVSTDSGATWTAATYGAYVGWASIDASASGSVLVAGSEGEYVYTSTDSGATWTARTSLGTATWYAVAVSSDGSTMVAGTDDGYMYKSTDNGANWTALTGAGTSGWEGIAVSSDGSKIAAVTGNAYGDVITSTDGGTTWDVQDEDLDEYRWYDIATSATGAKITALSEDYTFTGLYD